VTTVNKLLVLNIVLRMMLPQCDNWSQGGLWRGHRSGYM